MTSRRLIPAVALLVAAAACGGDDDTSDGASGDASTTTVAAVSTTGSDDERPPSTREPTSTSGTPSTTLRPSASQPVPDPGGPASSVPPGQPVGPEASADVAAAVADLAARLGVEPGQVRLVSEQEVTWRSSAIGCPEPGMNYLDRLVDGVRVVLEVDGSEYSYHAGGSRSIFYCEQPQLPGD